jgi:HSP20 family protein
VGSVSTPTHSHYLGPFPDLFDWLEAPLALARSETRHILRLEDCIKEGRYVLRAELPGIAPRRDLQLTVGHGALTIRATRLDETEGAHRSEFRYGVFTRSVPLPANADEEHIRAGYDNGILEITVPLKDADTGQRHIPIQTPKHDKPAG